MASRPICTKEDVALRLQTHKISGVKLYFHQIRLKSEEDWKIEESKIDHLKKAFEAQQWSRVESRHFVEAMVSHDDWVIINEAVQSRRTPFTEIDLGKSIDVEVLDGRHRLRAGETSVDWWVFNLYPEDLPGYLQRCIIENEDIYVPESLIRKLQTLQSVHKEGQDIESHQAFHSIEPNARNRLGRLFKKDYKPGGPFRELFKFDALFDGVKLGSLNMMEPLRFNEEIIRYIEEIDATWTLIEDYHGELDRELVCRLQGLHPCSSADYDRIEEWAHNIRVKTNKTIDEMNAFMKRISERNKIVSVETLLRDIRLLEACAGFLTRLVPKGCKGTSTQELFYNIMPEDFRDEFPTRWSKLLLGCVCSHVALHRGNSPEHLEDTWKGIVQHARDLGFGVGNVTMGPKSRKQYQFAGWDRCCKKCSQGNVCDWNQNLWLVIGSGSGVQGVQQANAHLEAIVWSMSLFLGEKSLLERVSNLPQQSDIEDQETCRSSSQIDGQYFARTAIPLDFDDHPMPDHDFDVNKAIFVANNRGKRNDYLQKENEHLHAKQTELQKDKDALQQKYDELRRQHNELQDYDDRLNRHSEGSHTRIQNEFQMMQNESEKLQEQNEETRRKYVELRIREEHIQRKEEELRTTQQNLEKEKEGLKCEREALKCEKETLQCEKETLRCEREALQRYEEKLQNEGRVLLKDKEWALEERERLRNQRTALEEDGEVLSADKRALQKRRRMPQKGIGEGQELQSAPRRSYSFREGQKRKCPFGVGARQMRTVFPPASGNWPLRLVTENEAAHTTRANAVTLP